MNKEEVKPLENSRVRVTYRNKVQEVNTMCGVLTALGGKYLILQPFGTMNELAINMDSIINVEKINGDE